MPEKDWTMMHLGRYLLLCLVLPALAWGQASVINGNRVHAGWTNYGTTAGTATAYTLTFSPALPGYVQGQCFLLKPHVTNTGAATLNVQGKGALSLAKESSGSLVPLVAGDLLLNRLVMACHDGTQLQLMGAAPDASATGVTNGDKTNITVSGTGAVWTIDAGAVTYSKLQNMSQSDRLLGRDTPGAGVVEELTPAAVKTMLGLTFGDITGDLPYTALTPAIAASRLLGRGSAAGAGDWQEVTLGTNLSMSGTTLNAAGAAGVPDGDKTDITVSSTGTVWTIDPNVVTYAKIQNVSQTDRLLGRDTAGAGVIEELTPAAVKTMLGITFGDITGAPATDAQIPDLNTLTTGLLISRCVETDGTGKLGVAAGACGVSGGSTGISGATNHGLMVATGGTTGSSLGVATNGQLPMGSTGADPVLAVPQGTTNQIEVVPGAGSLLWRFPATGVTLPGTTTANLASATSLPIVGGTTGTLTAARGGTEVTTAPDDNVLVGNGTVWQLKALPNCVAANESMRYTAATNVWSCGTVSAGHTIQDEGVARTARTNLNFLGTGVSCVDNAGANATDCTVSGTGSSVILDLADNGVNESTALAEVATLGDTTGVFTEPSADKLLIDLTKKWPTPPAFGDLTGIATAAQLPNAAADGATEGRRSVSSHGHGLHGGGV